MNIKWLEVLRRALATRIRMSLLSAAALIGLECGNVYAADWNTAVNGETIKDVGNVSVLTGAAAAPFADHTWVTNNRTTLQIGEDGRETTGNETPVLDANGNPLPQDTTTGSPGTVRNVIANDTTASFTLIVGGNQTISKIESGSDINGNPIYNTITAQGGNGIIRGRVELSGVNNTLKVNSTGSIGVIGGVNEISLLANSAAGKSAIINDGTIVASQIITSAAGGWNINAANTLVNNSVGGINLYLQNALAVNIGTTVEKGGTINFYTAAAAANVTIDNNSAFNGTLRFIDNNMGNTLTLAGTTSSLTNLIVGGNAAANPGILTLNGGGGTINDLNVRGGSTLTLNNDLTISKRLQIDGTLTAAASTLTLSNDAKITNNGIFNNADLDIAIAAGNTATIDGGNNVMIGELQLGDKATLNSSLSGMISRLTIGELNVFDDNGTDPRKGKTNIIAGSGETVITKVNLNNTKNISGNDSILIANGGNLSIDTLEVTDGGELRGNGAIRVEINAVNVNSSNGLTISGNREWRFNNTNIADSTKAPGGVTITIANDKNVDLGRIATIGNTNLTSTLNLKKDSGAGIFTMRSDTAVVGGMLNVAADTMLEVTGVWTWLTIDGGDLNVDGVLRLTGTGNNNSTALRSFGGAEIKIATLVLSGRTGLEGNAPTPTSKITNTEFANSTLTLAVNGYNLGMTSVNGESNRILAAGNTLNFNKLTVRSGGGLTLENGTFSVSDTNGGTGIAEVSGRLTVADTVTKLTLPTLKLNGSLVVDSAPNLLNVNNLEISGATLSGRGLTVGNSTTLNGALTVSAVGNGDWNLTKTAINGASTLMVRGGTLNLGELNASAPLTLANGLASATQVTNDNALIFAGGNLTATGAVTNNGRLEFNLDRMTKGETAAAVLDVTAAGITFGKQASIKLVTSSGGIKSGERYNLISDKDNQGDLVADLIAQNNIANDESRRLLQYMGGTEETLAGGKFTYFVTVNVNHDALNSIVQDGLKASDANLGVAYALKDIFTESSLTAEAAKISDILSALDQTANAGAAITQLNNTNASTAVMGMGKNAAQQLNTAMTQMFTEHRNTQLVAGIIGAPQRRGGEAVDKVAEQKISPDKKSSAAGGLPSRQYSMFDHDEYNWGGFVKSYGGFGAQKTTFTATGYDFGGVGVAAGIDRTLAENFRIGGLIGYSYNRTELNYGFGKATDKVLRGGLYANFDWEKLFINIAPSVALHTIESERNLAFMGAVAKADRTGMDFNFYTQLGYNFELPHDFILTPSFTFAATCLHDPEYTEINAGGANLHVTSLTNWSLLQNLELKIGKIWQLNERVIILPEAWFGWEYEFAQANDVSVNFAAVPTQAWNTPISQPTSSRAVFGMGLSTILSNRYEIFGRYDQKLWDGGYATNFAIGVGVKF